MSLLKECLAQSQDLKVCSLHFYYEPVFGLPSGIVMTKANHGFKPHPLTAAKEDPIYGRKN